MKKLSQEDIEKLFQLYRNEDYEHAKILAQSLLQDYPDHPFILKVISSLLNKEGLFEESLIIYEKLIFLNPDDFELHFNYANVLHKLKRLPSAEKSYRKAISLNPNFADAYCNLGVVEHELEKLKEAELNLLKAINVNKDFAFAYYNLGNVLRGLTRYEEAKNMYLQAIDLKNDYTEAFNNLALTYKDLGNYQEAINWNKRAIEIMPTNYKAYNNLGSIYNYLGKLEDAIDCYKKVNSSIKPDNLESQQLQLEAQHLLSALEGKTTSRPPREYVERLFDQYAINFENNLVNELEYNAHKLITDLLIKRFSNKSLGSVLDLGCGTGLVGEQISGFAKKIIGVDISCKMIQKAELKNVYDRLFVEDIVTYLKNENIDFDIFISTDVFIYIGDVEEIFNLIKTRNKSGGKFAFTTEHNIKSTGFKLETSGRYSHSKEYIESLCKKFNFNMIFFEKFKLRKEKNDYINGGLYLLDF